MQTWCAIYLTLLVKDIGDQPKQGTKVVFYRDRSEMLFETKE